MRIFMLNLEHVLKFFTYQVKCFALNRMDIVQREGKYPPPPGASPILGVEVSGTVESVGSSGR